MPAKRPGKNTGHTGLPYFAILWPSCRHLPGLN
jgi:hypothetical protein